MKFENGKTYKYIDGSKMTIIGELDTRAYGRILVGEDEEGNLYPVGVHEKNTFNWVENEKEITR